LLKRSAGRGGRQSVNVVPALSRARAETMTASRQNPFPDAATRASTQRIPSR